MVILPYIAELFKGSTALAKFRTSLPNMEFEVPTNLASEHAVRIYCAEAIHRSVTGALDSAITSFLEEVGGMLSIDGFFDYSILLTSEMLTYNQLQWANVHLVLSDPKLGAQEQVSFAIQFALDVDCFAYVLNAADDIDCVSLRPLRA